MVQESQKKVKVRFEPAGVTAEALVGSHLLDTALEAGVHINASCGGRGVCGKCRVILEQGDVEGGLTEKINREEAAKGVRQACLATLREDVVVRVPVESALDKTALKALVTGKSQRAVGLGAEDLKAQGRFDPSLQKVVVSAPPPSLEDNRTDVKRLLTALREKDIRHLDLDFEAIRDLPHAWREGDWTVTATFLRPVYHTGRRHVIRVEPGDTVSRNLAVAIDLGTTTVWAQLIDLVSGTVLGMEGDFNDQISYGEDVISRIVYAEKPGGLKKLQQAAANSINRVLEGLARATRVDPNDIGLAVLAGNTTMTQIFLGLDPTYIRLDPYVPTATFYPPVRACRFGLDLPQRTHLILFPSVASYVGGDVVAGVLGVGMHKDERLTLFIDMGTNGEVVVGNKDWLACAAASAGPAFEGGGIKHGMRATKGAIESFSVNPVTGEPALITVGRVLPKGICGSGLIAAVAALFIGGIIDESGRFNLDHVSDRVREGEDGPEYVLAWANDTQIERDITLTEVDIDNLMRAKGAMYAAYTTLLTSVGLGMHDLERVILAGGFGQSLNIERAVILGLLPELPLDRFTFIGNGSLLGARLAALSSPLREEVTSLVERMTNFELSVAPGYMDNYTGSLFLPHTECTQLFPRTCARLKEAREALRKVG